MPRAFFAALITAALALTGGSWPARATQATWQIPSSPLSMLTLQGILNNAFAAVGTCNSGNSAPTVGPLGAPIAAMCWINTSVTPWTFNVYDGAQWVTLFTLNAGTHVGTVPLAVLPAPFTNGTASGNTSEFATVTGTTPSGDCAKWDANGNVVDAGAACATQSSGANPSATAGPSAINGSSPNFMRADAAPAVQKGTNAQFGLVEGDTTTITCAAGVCSEKNGAANRVNGLVPTGTTNTTGVMMGLGASCSITPTKTGRVLFSIQGSVANGTSGDGWTISLREGTGSAPANGAALTGTVISSPISGTAAAAGQKQNFNVINYITGLSLGTAVWFDIGLAAVTGGTATANIADCIATEF